MYYLRARWYDQQTGRFNRMDPFAGNNQDPQSLHKYLYAHSNPVNVTDKSGLFGSYIDVMSTAYVRSVLANLQQSVGDYVFLSVEAARAGWSVAQTFKWALAITIGVVGAWLLGKVLKVIRRLPSLFRSSADDLPRGIAFRGTVWRGVPEQYVDDIWRITPHQYGGGRYSPVGRGTLCTSTTLDTSMAEVAARADVSTRTFRSKDISVPNMLDLTNPEVLRWLGTTKDDLTRTADDIIRAGGEEGAEYVLTNAIGDFARTRYNGMVAPSARKSGGVNIILFIEP
jgi:RES domain-containing protein